jgi:hypothetical protein
MTHEAISSKFVVPAMLAVAFTISIASVYVTDKYRVTIDRAEASRSVADTRGSAELPKPDGRYSRVRLVLSSMK